MKRIGIITSGGDCGGLNAVIKSAAREAYAHGIETVVIPNGYAGLYNLVDLENVVVLNAERVSRIEASLAGSEAGHSRVKISKIKDPNTYDRIKAGLKKFKIDALIISGGDDTGSVVIDLNSHGIPCVHVPKTMDLDLQPYSVGGDSAVNRIALFTRDIKTTGMSHNRIIVMEVFGRYVGHTALRGGVGAEADCILLPEVPVDFDVVYEHMKATYFARVERSDVKAGTYIIVAAEGIKTASGELLYDESAGVDAFGHKKLAGAGKYVKQQLEKRLKADPAVKEFMKRAGMYAPGVYEIPEVREVMPGHLVRSGPSSAYDVNFGQRAGAASVLLLLESKTGNTVVDVEGSKIFYIATSEAIKRREVDISELALFESLGTCFGRKPGKFGYELVETKGVPKRHL
ncbi:MAG: 6-phosphofructokinase [Nitrospirae bacterium GWF2_44_13]|nr:MAG: 6-phosphofructokinase [Nitrospirae bacterium GWF2_44_13]OGW33817.1 MAG: 6-phosphofructokinase [Nitrospirae bacterium GWD2_44_7]OGW65825.1 MAG: 6-phosphofructokinase [Nitrospirae bacterium RIFOXYA2_FULL_44_9]HBG92708.1 6-phosphofructokinase [Nitrospiraceae bacterium]